MMWQSWAHICADSTRGRPVRVSTDSACSEVSEVREAQGSTHEKERRKKALSRGQTGRSPGLEA